MANMERVLDVYKRPYDIDYPVICMDESPKQLISSAQPSTPIKPGQDARVDYEYLRHGMVNIFMANEPLKGKRIVEITKFKTKKDWAKFIKRIADEYYPKSNKITLVMEDHDNLLWLSKISIVFKEKVVILHIVVVSKLTKAKFGITMKPATFCLSKKYRKNDITNFTPLTTYHPTFMAIKLINK